MFIHTSVAKGKRMQLIIIKLMSYCKLLFRKGCVVFCLVWLFIQVSSAATLTNYSQCLYALDKPGSASLSAIRMAVMADDTFFLAVDAQELSTQLVKKQFFNVKKLSSGLFDSLFSKTTYGLLLAEARQRDFPLQDAGITHSIRSGQGIDLTIDLCPSSKPLARSFFTCLIDAFAKEERPVPVSIAITGVWMKEHPDDFKWLVGHIANGDLAITWINHSYSHRFSKTMPLKQNFLLEQGTNLENEILGTEKALIDNGQIPSVFFRFPGLISDREIYLKVISYGLIPIGSDAWLAKNQQPHSGSIVLVHANGNEPLGLEKFFQLVKEKSATIADKEWFLYDLSESLELKDSATEQKK